MAELSRLSFNQMTAGKASLREVVYEKDSLMPAFGPGRLNDSDLGDLVGYLSTLRGADVTVR